MDVQILEKYKDPEWFRHQWTDLNKTIKEIAKECGVSYNTIYLWSKRHNIKERGKKICPCCEEEFDVSKWRPDQQYCGPRCTDFINNCRRNNINISYKEYNKILTQQEGRCKICGIHQSQISQRLSIDHNHKSGVVRGLLCLHCNNGLGAFKDNIFSLIKAINYLRGSKYASVY